MIERARHLRASRIVYVGVILACPAVGHEAGHAAHELHGVVGVPERRAALRGGFALPAGEVARRLHRHDSVFVLLRTVAHAHD